MSGYDSHAVIVKLCVLYNCTKLYKNALIRAAQLPTPIWSSLGIGLQTFPLTLTPMTCQ